MTDVATLVERVASGEDGDAASALVSAGGQAVEPLVTALSTAERRSARPLRQVLSSIRDPEAVPRLVEAMDEDGVEVPLAVFTALGASRDARPVEPLREYARGAKGEMRQVLAVKALGEIGDSRAVDDLERVARQADREFESELFVAAVTALAKLGDHSQAPLLVRAWREVDDPVVLARYAEALKQIVAPGILQVMVDAPGRSDDPATQRDAFRGLQLLGSPEAAAALAEAAADERVGAASEAEFAFDAVTGAGLPGTAPSEDAREWWTAHEGDFETGIVYRLGKPLDVSDVIPLLDDRRQARPAAEELYVITGERFENPPVLPEGGLPSPRERAEEWWRSHGERFEPGRLYKFGHRQELEVALEADGA